MIPYIKDELIPSTSIVKNSMKRAKHSKHLNINLTLNSNVLNNFICLVLLLGFYILDGFFNGGTTHDVIFNLVLVN